MAIGVLPGHRCLELHERSSSLASSGLRGVCASSDLLFEPFFATLWRSSEFSFFAFSCTDREV